MTMTNRTLTDIRENLDYVGCDNATALDLCAQIDRLTRDLDLARAEADRLQSYRETWERTRMSWEAENERLKAGIQHYLDGGCNRPGIANKRDTCPHGKFGWEACEACIDAHFTKVLRPDDEQQARETETAK